MAQPEPEHSALPLDDFGLRVLGHHLRPEVDAIRELEGDIDGGVDDDGAFDGRHAVSLRLRTQWFEATFTRRGGQQR